MGRALVQAASVVASSRLAELAASLWGTPQNAGHFITALKAGLVLQTSIQQNKNFRKFFHTYFVLNKIYFNLSKTPLRFTIFL